MVQRWRFVLGEVRGVRRGGGGGGGGGGYRRTECLVWTGGARRPGVVFGPRANADIHLGSGGVRLSPPAPRAAPSGPRSPPEARGAGFSLGALVTEGLTPSCQHLLPEVCCSLGDDLQLLCGGRGSPFPALRLVCLSAERIDGGQNVGPGRSERRWTAACRSLTPAGPTDAWDPEPAWL
ncbi:unnamed protein product, partial [Gadus morhua 'NCC']